MYKLTFFRGASLCLAALCGITSILVLAKLILDIYNEAQFNWTNLKKMTSFLITKIAFI